MKHQSEEAKEKRAAREEMIRTLKEHNIRPYADSGCGSLADGDLSAATAA